MSAEHSPSDLDLNKELPFISDDKMFKALEADGGFRLKSISFVRQDLRQKKPSLSHKNPDAALAARGWEKATFSIHDGFNVGEAVTASASKKVSEAGGVAINLVMQRSAFGHVNAFLGFDVQGISLLTDYVFLPGITTPGQAEMTHGLGQADYDAFLEYMVGMNRNIRGSWQGFERGKPKSTFWQTVKAATGKLVDGMVKSSGYGLPTQ